ncbi:hypothetical protein Tco_0822097 [Tanacetum coccineum]|uniref:Uncharacterized protein n=1 Tax=Tanacetum coccineum TaxID=301880 RepID=A0ABQ5AIC4_9ASTR
MANWFKGIVIQMLATGRYDTMGLINFSYGYIDRKTTWVMPEGNAFSRFVTIVKQQHKLDEVSYHKFFDILKQYQKEVNELRAERIAKSHATTRHKGKEIAKQITPPSESPSDEDSEPEQAQKDKEMQKNLALIAKYFKKLYKPTNKCGKGVQLQAEQFDWIADTDEEIDEQELEVHYSYMAKIQEVHNADSGTDSEPLEQVQYDTEYDVFANETVDSNVILDSPDMCDNDIQNDQNDVECDDERVALLLI